MIRRSSVLLIAACCVCVMFGGSMIAPVQGQSATPTASVITLPASQTDSQIYNVYYAETEREPNRFDRTNAGLSRMAGLFTRYGGNGISLDWRAAIPTNADLVVIAGPQTELSTAQIARLWVYLENGGRLLLLGDPITNTQRALPGSSGLFSLLEQDYGIALRGDAVLNATAPDFSGTPLPTPENKSTPSPVAAPLLPELDAVPAVADQPIVAGLTRVKVFGARSVVAAPFTGDSSAVALLKVDESVAVPVYGESAYLQYLTTGIITRDDKDTADSALFIAAASVRPNGSRVVLIGDASVALNGQGLQTAPAGSDAFLYPDNARFLVNAFRWLVDAPAVTLPAFPTPGATETATLVPTVTPTLPG